MTDHKDRLEQMRLEEQEPLPKDGMADKIRENLIGMFAHDEGSVDSGIRNDTLKHEIKTWIDANRQKNAVMDLLTDICLKDFDPKHGYTLEDIKNFIDWLSDEMDYDI